MLGMIYAAVGHSQIQTFLEGNSLSTRVLYTFLGV